MPHRHERKWPGLDWDELRDYWEHHAERDGQLDLARDPDALGNVCWPGQPLWLNRHLAHLQERAYGELLALMTPSVDPQRALDIGCGSGRWCRTLAARGVGDVVGIDLQQALIEQDRQRMPTMTFHHTSLQEFADPEPFDILSSVTVIQHNPYDHHADLAARMRSLLREGGHAVILENVRDTSAYTFPRSVDGWTRVFEGAGFATVAQRPYDFSPFLRAVLGARDAVQRSRSRNDANASTAPSTTVEQATQKRGSHGALMLALRAAVTLDRPVESVLARRPQGRTSIHCGFLFRAV